MSNFNEKLFIENSLIFENENRKLLLQSKAYQDENLNIKFGILNLKAIPTILNKNLVYEFIFTIDCSGSMSDKCSDGRSKMQHIIHTLTNMILYFKENSLLKVFITVNTFHSKIQNIITRTSINNDNCSIILDKINSIVAKDSTNIELALNSVKNTIDKIKNMYSEHIISHIFMTDGEITQGNADYDYLLSLVDKSISNTFIGFGLEHDSVLLNALSNGENSSYYFIDKLENSGFVYGEILHGIIYKLLYDVQIILENGLIYDFKKNIWVASLTIGEIIAEANKIYHIISSTPMDCIVKLFAKKTLDNSEIHLKIMVSQEKGNSINSDLTKYIYRQRTLEYLFIVKDFLRRRSNSNIINDKYLFGFINENENENLLSSFQEEERVLRDKLSNFLEELKKYMTDNNLNNDCFLKNLCDDIYITFRTFGTRFGAMYVSSRQNTQGTQRCYTVGNSIDTQIPKLSLLRLKKNNKDNHDGYISDEYNDCCTFIEHEVSDIGNTPYQSPGAIQMMRDISYNNNNIFNQPEEESQIL
jgi:hypothetical protein